MNIKETTPQKRTFVVEMSEEELEELQILVRVLDVGTALGTLSNHHNLGRMFTNPCKKDLIYGRVVISRPGALDFMEKAFNES